MKYTLKRLACIAMMASIGIVAAVAQNAEKSIWDKLEFSAYLGLRNIPIGNLDKPQIMNLDGYLPVLLEYSERYPGGALSFGHLNFGAKLKYNLETGKDMVGIIFTADRFYINSYPSPIANDEYEVFTRSFLKGGYVNIPVMVGLNRTYQVTDDMSIWCEAAIGMNYRRIKRKMILLNSLPSPEIEDDDDMQLKWQFADYNYIYTEEFDKNFTFAGQMSAGIKLGRITFGMYYYYLGKAKPTGTYNIKHQVYNEETKRNEWVTLTENQPLKYKPLSTSMIVFRLGLHF